MGETHSVQEPGCDEALSDVAQAGARGTRMVAKGCRGEDWHRLEDRESLGTGGRIPSLPDTFVQAFLTPAEKSVS